MRSSRHSSEAAVVALTLRRFGFRCLVAAALVLAAGSTALAAPEASAPTGRVAVVLSNGSASWIVAGELGAAGQEITPVAARGELRHDMQPEWSADGSMLAFRRKGVRPDRGGVFTIKSDGTELRRLATPSRDANRTLRPRWSPDGTQIVYEAGSGCGTGKPFTLRMVALTLAGQATDVPALTQRVKEAWIEEFSFAPDASRLLYIVLYPEREDCRTRFPETELYTIGLNGRGRKLLVRAAAVEATWSPDGKQIAYLDCGEAWLEEGCNLGLIRADGTGRRRLARHVYSPDESCIAWTPDGSGVLVAEPDSLRVVSLATGKPRILARFQNSTDSFGTILDVSDDYVAVEAGQTLAASGRYQRTGVRVRLVPLSGGDSREIRLRVPSPKLGIDEYGISLD